MIYKSRPIFCRGRFYRSSVVGFTKKTPIEASEGGGTDLGEYGPNVVVLADDSFDIDGAQFGDLVEEYGNVWQLRSVVVGQSEQLGRLNVMKTLVGIINVLLKLVNERRELADSEVTATHVVADGQRQPVHPLRRRVHQLVDGVQVSSQYVNLQCSAVITQRRTYSPVPYSRTRRYQSFLN